MDISKHVVSVPIGDYIAMKNAYENMMSLINLPKNLELLKKYDIHIHDLSAMKLATGVTIKRHEPYSSNPNRLDIKFIYDSDIDDITPIHGTKLNNIDNKM